MLYVDHYQISVDPCDDLLELFHRSVEFGAAPKWEGGTVDQVCLSEGTTVYVDPASAAVAALPTVFNEPDFTEELQRRNAGTPNWVREKHGRGRLQHEFSIPLIPQSMELSLQSIHLGTSWCGNLPADYGNTQ